MPRRALAFALMIGAGLAMFALRARGAQIAVQLEPGDDARAVQDDPSQLLAEIMTPDEVKALPEILSSAADADTNRAAFLALIREFESNGRYNVMYGGQTFSSFAAHPRVAVPINIPGYEGKYSTAAGAYQFIFSTWENQRVKLGLPDFSPASQDAAALGLLADIGALAHIDAGNLDAAMRLAAQQWASLPYSPAKQNPKSIAAANVFLHSELAA